MLLDLEADDLNMNASFEHLGKIHENDRVVQPENYYL